MCDRCTEIDEKVARYRQLTNQLLDQPVLEKIESVIANLSVTKQLFHPTQE